MIYVKYNLGLPQEEVFADINACNLEVHYIDAPLVCDLPIDSLKYVQRQLDSKPYATKIQKGFSKYDSTISKIYFRAYLADFHRKEYQSDWLKMTENMKACEYLDNVYHNGYIVNYLIRKEEIGRNVKSTFFITKK